MQAYHRLTIFTCVTLGTGAKKKALAPVTIDRGESFFSLYLMTKDLARWATDLARVRAV